MDNNEPIHSRRLLLLTIGGIAIIFLAYLVSADASEVQSPTNFTRSLEPVNASQDHKS